MGNIFMGEKMLPTNIVGFRYNIAINYLNKVEKLSRLCQIYNTTRKTILKWKDLYCSDIR